MTNDIFLPARATSLYEAFAGSAEKFAQQPCLDIPGDAAYSYEVISNAAHLLAEQFEGAGYGLGHRIATALDNSAEFFIHYLAANKLGISLVPLNSGMPAGELAYLIGHSDAACVIARPEHLEHIGAAVSEVEREVPCLEMGDALPPAPAPLDPAWPAGLEAEAAILYTSGTTGKPKGCMLSNEYIVMLGEHYSALGGHCTLEEGKERLITPLPVNHMNAMACSFPVMVMNGGCLIQLDRFSSKTWWDLVRTTEATCLHYLGVMPAMLLNMPARADDDFSKQIKFGFGAGVDPKHQLNFETRFGFPLIEAWSMTETGAGGWTSCEHEPRHVGQRCIGLPRKHMDMKLVGEDGEEVARGEPGEILVRTKGDDPRRYFFTAYYKDPEATEKAWEGGYFHTGDVVRQDDDGYYYFVDRNKNIVRRSGENIAAVEVESVINPLPHVAACAVVPIQDDIRGEEVGVIVQLDEEGEASAEKASQIQTAVSETLVYYKAPGWVGFVEALPQTASQKLARGEVKKLARAMLEAGTLIDIRSGKSRKKAS